ncbi:MAG: LON peptidase substrate-binding domain-containing protein [Gemmataceae bacterium]|nr:LON peptidase substrate-binding domain-containing protein [Gemmataceae bacterium]
MSDDTRGLDDFNGVVRLFPLPNVVLFPHVIQPLHIFEPRYRQMTADALEGDRLIAPALLRPGWEADYEGLPGICPVVCIGRIIGDQRLADGRYNLLLRGVSRARVVEELVQEKPYRSARVELLTDGPQPAADAAKRFQCELDEVVRAWFPPHGPALEQLHKLLRGELPLGTLCDILAFAVPLPVEVKQGLLEERDVEARTRALLQHLTNSEPTQASKASDRKFPPGFSKN